MRVSVRQEWTVKFEPATNGVIGVLRMTPRGHDGQQISDWRLDLSADCRLRQSEDAYGNLVHSFEASGPLEKLTIEAHGEVDLYDTTGFVRAAVERFPEELFLRESPLAIADAALRAFAEGVAPAGDAPLSAMHALASALHEAVAFEPELAAHAGASEAFAAKKASARDMAHLFIAGARHRGVPARYVSGVALDAPKTGHAWAEAWLEGYGWIAFDPALDICPCGRHVRVAVGLDARDAGPIRQARQGYGQDSFASALRFDVRSWGSDQ